MTLLNIHMKEDEKKKLQEFIEQRSEKSLSDFVRNVVSEKIQIEELVASKKKHDNPNIPDYVPKNKYVAFVNGAIVEIGDNPSELAEIAMKKFPNLPCVILFNGPQKKKLEYSYLGLKDFQAWNYYQVADDSFPVVPIELQTKTSKKQILS